MSRDEQRQGLPDDLQRTHPYDLGVMLVHGIGQQRRGDTLEYNGGALLESIRSYVEGWLGDDVDARVSVERTSVGDTSGPEYFVADIDISRRAAPDAPLAVSERRRWLIAESHWADVFPAPTYKEIADWVVNVLPVVAAIHFDRRYRRALAQLHDVDSEDNTVQRCWRVALRLGGAVAAAVGVPLLMLVLLALLALGLLPLPFVKEPARLAQRLLAGSVGDSFVLLERPVSSARIIDRVRRDMCWLGDCCERVAMVAHSQGGAVAHEVVRSNPRMPCDLLLTYGSGLRKLGMLTRYLHEDDEPEAEATTVREAARSRRPVKQRLELWGGLVLLSMPWAVILGQILFAGGTQYLLSTTLSPPQSLLPPPELLLISGASFLIGIFVVRRWARRHGTSSNSREQCKLDKQIFHGQYELTNASTRWVDIYSTHDPVPNGPLLDQYVPPTLETHEVTVFGSMFSDHTGYWESKDDFLLGLTRELFALDNGAPQEDNDGEVTAEMRAWAVRLRRRMRVAWTTLTPTVAGLLALLVVTRLWTDPPELYIRLALNVADIVRSVPLIGEALVGTAEDPHHNVLVVLASVVLVAAVYLLMRRLWGQWDADESQRAVSGCVAAAPSLLPLRLIVYILAATVLVAAGVFIWLGVPGALAVACAVGLALLIVYVTGDQSLALDWRKLRAEGGWRHALAEGLRQQDAANRPSIIDSTRRRAQYLRGAQLTASDDPAAQKEGRALLQESLGKGYGRAGYVLGSFLERKRQDYVGAANAFKKAGELGHDYGKVRHAQLLLGPLDQPEKGEQVLFDAADGDGDEYAYALLADVFEQRAETQRARELLRRFLNGTAGEIRRQSRYCAWQLARLGENADETVSALWVALKSGELRAAARLADEFLRRGERAEAINVLRDGAALGSAESALRLGELLRDEDDEPGATAAWRRAIELASRRLEAPANATGARFGDVEPADLEMRHGAAAAAEMAALAQEGGRPLASRRVAYKGLRLAEQAALAAPATEQGHKAVQEHAGVQRLGLERSEAAFAVGDVDDGEAAARLALTFGSVEAGLLLVERCRFDDPEQAEVYARRAVAFEARWLWQHAEAPAHRTLSDLLERRDGAQDESVALLRSAALSGGKEGSGNQRGDVEAMNRIVGWLGMFRFEHGREFPDLDGFLEEVRERWYVPHSRFRVVRALLGQRETLVRLEQASRILEETWCQTDAEQTVHRHLAERVAEQLAERRE